MAKNIRWMNRNRILNQLAPSPKLCPNVNFEARSSWFQNYQEKVMSRWQMRFFPLLKHTTISLTIVRKRNRWNDSRSLMVCAPFWSAIKEQTNVFLLEVFVSLFSNTVFFLLLKSILIFEISKFKRKKVLLRLLVFGNIFQQHRHPHQHCCFWVGVSLLLQFFLA